MDRDDRWEAAEEGAELIREGEMVAAIVELERVLAGDADNEYALFFLGNAWFAQEDFPKALKAYVSALEKKPDYLGAMIGAGHTLRMMSKHEQAIRMGRQALLAKKDDPDALYLLGLVHYQRGDRAQALEYLERFLSTRPEIEVATEVNGLLQVLRGEVVPSDQDDDLS